MFSEADKGLSKYRNIIGIGVIIMLITFSGIFLYTSSQQKKIATDCGFSDGKLRCVCTQEAWDEFNLGESGNLQIPKSLNTSTSSKITDGEENYSTTQT